MVMDDRCHGSDEARLAGSICDATGFALFSNLVNILLLFAGVSIAVAWHRLLILGERPGFSGANVATGNLWHYVGMGIVIFLISFLPALAIVFSMSALLAPANEGVPTPTVIALALLLYAVGAVAALRLSLLLPARAIADRGLTFRQTWVRTRGNTWRLFWGIVVTTVPPLPFKDTPSVLAWPTPCLIAAEPCHAMTSVLCVPTS